MIRWWRHRPPGRVRGGGLREPDVARIARRVSGAVGPEHRVAVADLDQQLDRFVVSEAELLLDLGRQLATVHLVEADVERLMASEDGGADPARTHQR